MNFAGIICTFSTGFLTASVLSTPDVKTIAQEITVKIEGAASGSGVMVEKAENTYYVLTNSHIVEESGTYIVITPDGNRYLVDNSQIILIPEVDLAILPISSNVSYPVAVLGNSDQLAPGEKVYVSGWPRSGETELERIYVNTEGMITENNPQNARGYTLSYTNLVRSGMSGGAIFDEQGKVVGINSLVRLVENSDTIVASGVGINHFINWRKTQTLPTLPPPQPIPTTSDVVTESSLNFSLATTLNSKGEVSSLAINQDLMVSGNSDGTISLWSLGNGKLITSWRGHFQAVNSVAIAPDGKTLATGSDDHTIKIWDLTTNKLIRTLTGHKNAVTTLTFTPDNQTLASGSWDQTIKLWHYQTGQLLHTLAGHSALVSSLAITPNGKILVSGSKDTTIILWDLNSGKLINILYGHSFSVLSVAISPDGQTLASGSGDGTISFWNLSTGKLTNTVRGHTDGVWSLAISPDNQTLVSGSWDKNLKLWDVKTGILNSTLTGHSNYIFSVAFTADGNTIISGGWDSQIMIWQSGEK
ncbi:MAG: trypsin-like peptidase domain-containing protein [Gomphosphaeria aponina SAG 52.96 = DSM 107014]|uniref:Trypsin-like peptidase domain-containing protein n=1 Tax=Gomphosphaeria aponina SAG 52.96 = DSM 107014 TaxID=1521640 RepID=A0A941GVS2_9CHRO|nr:trypsin-like peptidase domain-containing protein [Gomphosphaeria aponina SAG 52.96 = DSM 107014]